MANQNARRDANHVPTLTAVEDVTGEIRRLKATNDGKLMVDCELEVADIQIGAVELKDPTDDNRATIDADGNLHVSVAELNGKLNRIKNADDYVQTFTYHGTYTDNVSIIVHSSATLAISVTETFDWTDEDHLNTITLS